MSVRVPWHDSGWAGAVCRDPLANASCVLLPNIGEKRDDNYEAAHAGLPFAQVDVSRIPCLAERGTFLSARPYTVTQQHPYKWKLDSLQPTPTTVPAYGVHATPFFWLHRDNVQTVLRDVRIDYRPEREDFVDEVLKFQPPWVMHGDNQQALIERFFADVVPEASLIFFYAKHSPFEGSGPARRLLVGAARVTGVELPGRWHTSGRSPFPNHMWETSVRHSLRPDGDDGILLPLAELARLDAEGEDVSSALAWAPEDGEREFSYVTEHVSSDTAIAALDRLFQAARRCADLGLDVPGAALTWVSDRIGELWASRGPAPGLGAVLSTLNIQYGPMVAREVITTAPADVDPWEIVVEEFQTPGRHEVLADAITSTPRKLWQTFDDTHRRALKLLTRFQLTHAQADAIFTSPYLAMFLENPYLAYTLVIEPPLRLSFDTIDRGCYPSASIRARFPLEAPSLMADATDWRRVEALLVDVLAEAADRGDTVVPLDRALAVIAERPLVEPCPVTELVLRAHDLHPTNLEYDEDEWSPLVGVSLADGSPAFKLHTLYELAGFIRERLTHQRAAPRLPELPDLAGLVASVLSGDDQHSEAERQARQEKTAALAELFAAPLSVLNGRAGTGKTTLIKALVQRLDSQGRSMLLLAPTGKARVQLQQKVAHEAQTLAQFLSRYGRYDPELGYFCDPGLKKAPHFDTVVVDECSMLTEAQLAALLDALPPPRRLILVGDPRQLPPIGAGRPFVDLITELTRGDVVPAFPRVAPGYAELTVLRRQKGETRDDLKLAAWFSGDEIPDGFDEVWQDLRTGNHMPSLGAIAWRGKRAETVVDQALESELGVGDADGFELSYGGRRNGEWVNFGVGSAADCESWQILSPTRGHAWGTVEVNRRLKHKHRGRMMRRARAYDSKRSVPKPIGLEQIVIGDKVLNNRNQSRRDGYPKGGLEYIANGEIGVVVGQTGKAGSRPQWTNVEFSSQLGITYGYRGDDEDDPTLELAWAITIHKSQGSEFGKVFVLLPSSIRRLSREMLYTALTRQKDKVVLLHEGSVDDLLDLTSATGSETARRLTDLFAAPDPRPVTLPNGTNAGLYDANLIHLTAGGVLVRSKNEVIVSRILDDVAPGAWTYEQPLKINGWTRWPDFTIVTPQRTVYWEHLGKLGDPDYAERWERKKRWYADGGVLPHDQGGGPAGTLMWTDDLDGVDVPGWQEFAKSVIGPGNSAPVAPSRTKPKVLKRRN